MLFVNWLKKKKPATASYWLKKRGHVEGSPRSFSPLSGNRTGRKEPGDISGLTAKTTAAVRSSSVPLMFTTCADSPSSLILVYSYI